MRFRRILSTVVAIALILPCTLMAQVNASTAEVQTFVTSLYADCLGRTPDPVGLNDWVTKLTNGTIGGKQCAYGFFFSPEFRSKANTLTSDALIDTYYRVFLNRTADAQGKTYWNSRIANTSTADDIIILFNGFADSTEFAQKCASYGITVGSANVPAVAGGNAPAPVVTNTNTTLDNIDCNTFRTNSPAELDAFFTSRGCEIRYITLPDANGGFYQVKVYAQFFNVDEHFAQLNAYRASCGQSSLVATTALMEEAKTRAVECAYTFTHTVYACMGVPGVQMASIGRGTVFATENITSTCDANLAFQNFLNSPGHANNMSRARNIECGIASCRIWVVSADGCSVNRNFTNGQPYNRMLGPSYEGNIAPGYGQATVQIFN